MLSKRVAAFSRIIFNAKKEVFADVRFLKANSLK